MVVVIAIAWVVDDHRIHEGRVANAGVDNGGIDQNGLVDVSLTVESAIAKVGRAAVEAGIHWRKSRRGIHWHRRLNRTAVDVRSPLVGLIEAVVGIGTGVVIAIYAMVGVRVKVSRRTHPVQGRICLGRDAGSS